MSSSESEGLSESEEEFVSEDEVYSKKRKSSSKKPNSKKKVIKKKKLSKKKSGKNSLDEDSSDGASSDSSDSSNSDSDDDDDERPVKKSRVSTDKRSTSSHAVTNRTASSTSNASTSSSSVKPKKIREVDRLEEARKAYKWWEAKPLPEGINWINLEHTGVIFAPPHVRHGVPLVYDGERIKLTLEQEELATFYAAIPDDGPQLGNPKTRSVFQKNFFIDFKDAFPPGHVVKKFDKCDFTLIKNHLDQEKQLRKAATDEEKAKKKEMKDLQVLKHGYALIDGRLEKMGNYNVEPPGLFRGRGEHPKTGVLKKRCFGESIHINTSEDAPVPVCALPGHAWHSVRHDPTVTWLCKWEENVMGQTKYVMLSASSSFKGISDREKYEKAIRLKSCIGRIRKDYTKKIKSKDKAERQLGTAMWVIDVLALRVGGEKNEDEADTVGCCSLRVEHMTFADKNNPDNYEIELEFLGKDSMLFRQNINFAQYEEIGKMVYNCLKSFCAGKRLCVWYLRIWLIFILIVFHRQGS